MREDQRSAETGFFLDELLALQVGFVGSFLSGHLPVLSLPCGGPRDLQSAPARLAGALAPGAAPEAWGSGVSSGLELTRRGGHWESGCTGTVFLVAGQAMSFSRRKQPMRSGAEVSAGVCGTRCPWPPLPPVWKVATTALALDE